MPFLRLITVCLACLITLQPAMAMVEAMSCACCEQDLDQTAEPDQPSCCAEHEAPENDEPAPMDCDCAHSCCLAGKVSVSVIPFRPSMTWLDHVTTHADAPSDSHMDTARQQLKRPPRANHFA